MKYNKSYVELRKTGGYGWRSCGRNFVVYISLESNYEQSSSDQTPSPNPFMVRALVCPAD
jgi:hypothetical protein